MKQNNIEPLIKELIVVEGKNDAHAIREAFGQVDVIWTEGFGLTKEKIKYIASMAEKQGVIVCTDPDYAGKLIREKIKRYVPEAKHVYLTKKVAIGDDGRDIGIENVSPTDLREAFEKVLIEKDSKENKEFFLAQYSMKDLLDNQLVGSDGAAEKRNYVGKNWE